MRLILRGAVPFLLVTGILSGCTTHSDGTAPLNQLNWPICSVAGGLIGGGLGAIESGAWAAGGGAAGIVAGGLICFALDGDEDKDGVFDRRDRCHGTPAGTPVRNNGCPMPQYPERVEPAPAPAPVAPVPEQVITLSEANDVLFAFDSSKLTPAGENELNKVVNELKGPEVTRIGVEGHTDSVGTDAYNQGLSERRAACVVGYLTAQGVDAAKLSSSGKGESQPVADNGTDAGRAQNRRVELHINR